MDMASNAQNTMNIVVPIVQTLWIHFNLYLNRDHFSVIDVFFSADRSILLDCMNSIAICSANRWQQGPCHMTVLCVFLKYPALLATDSWNRIVNDDSCHHNRKIFFCLICHNLCLIDDADEMHDLWLIVTFLAFAARKLQPSKYTIVSFNSIFKTLHFKKCWFGLCGVLMGIQSAIPNGSRISPIHLSSPSDISPIALLRVIANTNAVFCQTKICHLEIRN